jgi:hypothetical protein
MAMTEAEWLAATDPMQMLEALWASGTASGRKARLFACGCCRHVWDQLLGGLSKQAVEATERLVDGPPGEDLGRLGGMWDRVIFEEGGWQSNKVASGLCQAVLEGWRAAQQVAWETSRLAARRKERQYQIALLRCILGPLPFRPVYVPPSVGMWNDGTVVRLAEAAYQERSFPEGTLDKARLAVLADAVEEAGSEDAELLGHLRGPGPHCRGCWPVDLLLNKE